jgi:ribonucleoside-triphosphate reductase
MSGCGVGYSVESQYVEQLPRIQRQKNLKPIEICVEDSQPGWADAFLRAMTYWFEGYDCTFDLSQLRPAGAILKTKGGRSSGPESFRVMLDLARNKILSRQGSFLRPLDAHDIMCSIGQAAVSGGVRRTALISLFDYDDTEMRLCKSGDFETNNSQRWNANNSAVLPMAQMTQRDMMRYVLDMYDSERGEPGIFSREVANALVPMRREKAAFGSNPCGEIILRPFEFCNLSVAVARADDTYESLREKVEIATIIGTIQSMATHFPGLRQEWKQNAQEERLLGVDINGQMDSPAAQDPKIQYQLRQYAIEVNRKYAQMLGINQSAAITCVKPSGNSSQLLNCSSGLHARWSKFYIRNVRVNVHGALFKVMKDAGVPMDPENGQTWENATTAVIHFPVKSPETAITRKDRSAIEQCNYWLQVKQNWTEHNPSVTITYRPDEEIEIMDWIWRNKNVIGGMAFLPAFDAQYAQLPYIEVSEEEYERLAAEFPSVDFSKIWRYEREDNTSAAQELACLAGACDV